MSCDCLKPDISVIVPVYNAEKTLRRCLDSLKKQTLKNLEFLLCNDGSSDTSGLICDEYASADSRFKVIHQNNGGVSSARNACLAAATGRYIAFVDSDDFCDDNTFELLLNCAVSNNAQLVICGFITISRGRSQASSPQAANYADWRRYPYEMLALLRGVFLNPPWGKLYLRSNVLYNFDEELNMGEDLIFNLAYLKNIDRVSVIPNTPVKFMVEPGGQSLSQKFNPAVMENFMYLHKKTEELFFESFPADFNYSPLYAEFSAGFRASAGRVLNNKQLSFKEKLRYYKLWLSDNEIFERLLKSPIDKGIEGIFNRIYKFKSPFMLYLALKVRKQVAKLRRHD